METAIEASVVARLREELPPADLRALVDEALGSCRALYVHGRSDQGLSIALALRDRLAALG